MKAKKGWLTFAGTACLVLSIITVWITGAHALPVISAEYHVKYTDASSLYLGATASALGTARSCFIGLFCSGNSPAIGDVLRAVTNADSYLDHANGDVAFLPPAVANAIFNSAVQAETTVLYDLRVSRLSVATIPAPIGGFVVDIGLVPAGIFGYTDTYARPGQALVNGGVPVLPGATAIGGHHDFYIQTLPPADTFNPKTGATVWIPGGAGAAKHTAAVPTGDAYPGINDAAIPTIDTIWLETVFMPIPAVLCNAPCVPGEVVNVTVAIDGAGVIKDGSSGFGFLNVIGNPLGFGFGPLPTDLTGGWTPAEIASIDMAFDFGLRKPIKVNGGAVKWLASSDDPLHYTVVPEPGTILLLGAGLIAVAGVARLRRKG